MKKHNLLKDKIFTTREGKRTLPEVLFLLSSNSRVGFPKISGYQEVSFHKFLVQVASLCNFLRRDVVSWELALLTLTRNLYEPWCLYVSDPTCPAFFQPPIYDPNQKHSILRYPDQISTLNVSRNHFAKGGKEDSDNVESWVYSLIDIQTSALSQIGRRGAARVSQGGSPTMVAHYVPSEDWSESFLSDFHKIPQEKKKELFTSVDMTRLLWMLPWDGKKKESLPIRKLHPLCIEISQRIRLNENLHALWYPSEGNRIDYKKEVSLYDPWTPGTLTKKRPLRYFKSKIEKDGISPAFIDRFITTPVNKRVECTISGEKDHIIVIRGNATAKEMRPSATYGLHHLTLPSLDHSQALDFIKRRIETKRIVEICLQRLENLFKYFHWDLSQWKIDFRREANSLMLSKLGDYEAWEKEFHNFSYEAFWRPYSRAMNGLERPYIKYKKSYPIFFYWQWDYFTKSLKSFDPDTYLESFNSHNLSKEYKIAFRIMNEIKSLQDKDLEEMRKHPFGMKSLSLISYITEGNNIQLWQNIFHHFIQKGEKTVSLSKALRGHPFHERNLARKRKESHFLKSLFDTLKEKNYQIKVKELVTFIFLPDGETLSKFLHLVSRGSYRKGREINFDPLFPETELG